MSEKTTLVIKKLTTKIVIDESTTDSVVDLPTPFVPPSDAKPL